MRQGRTASRFSGWLGNIQRRRSLFRKAQGVHCSAPPLISSTWRWESGPRTRMHATLPWLAVTGVAASSVLFASFILPTCTGFRAFVWGLSLLRCATWGARSGLPRTVPYLMVSLPIFIVSMASLGTVCHDSDAHTFCWGGGSDLVVRCAWD